MPEFCEEEQRNAGKEYGKGGEPYQHNAPVRDGPVAICCRFFHDSVGCRWGRDEGRRWRRFKDERSRRRRRRNHQRRRSTWRESRCGCTHSGWRRRLQRIVTLITIFTEEWLRRAAFIVVPATYAISSVRSFVHPDESAVLTRPYVVGFSTVPRSDSVRAPIGEVLESTRVTDGIIVWGRAARHIPEPVRQRWRHESRVVLPLNAIPRRFWVAVLLACACIALTSPIRTPAGSGLRAVVCVWVQESCAANPRAKRLVATWDADSPS